ncbi:NRDE family protein [Marinobacter salinisoli]|uniref:NRDE family protein n=1 Tax=Marinobacter salinisoli TaxID=2769486 RepID=A0ABX7N198_9GAMM|nr:NRDE family protein [Marinobacter salinisoli]QSP96183.1 NRDE family protein [Marinobacter salinisoli]
MCLIAFALRQSPDFPLVVAANRDEFFRRPTTPMDWWTTDNGTAVLSGRDEEAGGTWLAITPNGTVSAVTNVREGSPERGQKSRGELPLRALEEPAEALQSELVSATDQYAGFNLIRLNDTAGWYFSNRDAAPGRHVHRGVYGLSNHLLQTPWPKLLRLRESLAATVASAAPDATTLHRQLRALLQDTAPAPDHLLPDTDVGLETERFLSSPFIVGETYGTRCTTIVTVSSQGHITVSEQTWGPEARPQDCRHFHWQR